jgi:hypothetical protein
MRRPLPLRERYFTHPEHLDWAFDTTIKSWLKTTPEKMRELWEMILAAGRGQTPEPQRGWVDDRFTAGHPRRVPKMRVVSMESQAAHQFMVIAYLPDPDSASILDYINDPDPVNKAEGARMRAVAQHSRMMYEAYRKTPYSLEDDESRTVRVEYIRSDENGESFETLFIVRNSGLIIPAPGWRNITYADMPGAITTDSRQTSLLNGILECAGSHWELFPRHNWTRNTTVPVAIASEKSNPRFMGDEFLLKPTDISEGFKTYLEQLGAFALFYIPFLKPAFKPYSLVNQTLIYAIRNRPTNFKRFMQRDLRDTYAAIEDSSKPARIGDEAMSTLSSCAMCGGPKPPAREREAICSDACLEAFESAHSSILLKQRIRTDAWSYLSKATASAHIGDESQDAAAFKRSVDNFTELKRQMDALVKETEGAKASHALLHEWIDKFDRIMRTLDSTLSQDFLRTLVGHVEEFHTIHDNISKAPATMGQIRGLLNEIVRAMPVGKIAEDQRTLIERILSRKLPNRNRLVLTLDGGGMRGVVTLLALKRLLAEIRRLSGRPNLRLDECFDMLVGTSTGGIIVTGICVAKRSIEEMLELYEKLGVFIFGDMSRINSLKFGILAQYGDKGILDLLLSVVGTKRLDDEDVAASDTRPRFAVTTVDISWKPSRARLLRNYGTEDGKGTNRAFVAEAVRATTAAGTFILPYSRAAAPMVVEYKTWTQSISSHYLHSSDTGKLQSNFEYIISHAPLPEDIEKLRERSKNDTFMSDSTCVDGGSWANNPTRIAIIEAKHEFTADNDGAQPFIHAFNFATGEMPAIRNESWSPKNPKPAEAAWLGEHGMKSAMTDLIMGSFVDPATETADTSEQLMEEYKDSVCIKRINPRLSRHFSLDDIKASSMKQMMDDTNAWLDSAEGREAINSCAAEVVMFSEKLKKP